MEKFLNMFRKLSSFQIIILGFAGVLLIGALLLMMPISSQSHTVTPFNEALFTSTSAVCVTGLVVHDTATYWSAFGQVVILILIQIGGLGVVTIAASLVLLSGGRIGLMQRSTMQEAIAAPNVGGIVRLTLFVLRATAVIEIIGMILLLPVFCMDYGLRGVWLAIFHSISAFCNAGFDLLGEPSAKYQSLVPYASNPLIVLTISVLIVVGGIGFLTWSDIRTHKFNLKKYRMQSKVILTTTVFLILIPAVFFFFADFANMPVGERILSSLFQAITPRTAGFNTADFSKMTGSSRGIIIFLMLIGGSPGSTAGGMKTTTFLVLILNGIATFQRKDNIEVFGRRLDGSVIKNATTILTMYLTLFFGGAVIVSMVEGLPFDKCLFETASAVGTVGVSLGLTPDLGIISKAVIIVLMFLGRVGGLTMIYAAVSPQNRKVSKLPLDKITVG